MIIREAIEDLDLFNRRLSELEGMRFFQRLQTGWAANINPTDCGWTSVMDGPDREAIKAIINDHRLFQQDNDRIALHRIAKVYHGLRAKSFITEDHVESFDKVRQQVLDFVRRTRGFSSRHRSRQHRR